ncbi:MAG: dTDP-4-dehydrorhamnose 3,5-epimerase [Ignavibacteria bacterium]|nr:dTDP-4-dehydrorhamnose 3,5-epimerase [Ignavibacteria bacterium]
MKFKKTPISGLLVIEPDVFEDNRGYFFESFSEKKYSELGSTIKFVQDNISKSKHGTVRGLHYQVGESSQGKLCQVLKGRVLDVAVDIRFGSPTFGKYFAIELSEQNHLQFWMPLGFAHGFAVLSDEAIFSYKCTALYEKTAERCIIYNDKSLHIDWMVENPIVSNKDLAGIEFSKIEEDFNFSIQEIV